MKRIRTKTTVIILFLFAFSWQIAGQTNVLFEKENFPPEQKNALKINRS